jgi:hypothetical protein
MAVFGRPEAGKAVMMLVRHYDEIIEKQKQLLSSSGDLERDFNSETNSMGARLKEFQNQLDRFKVEHMKTALDQLSAVLDQLNKHPFIPKAMMLVAGLVGAGMLIERVVKLFNFFTGRGKETGKAAPAPERPAKIPGIGDRVPGYAGREGFEARPEPWFPKELLPGKTGPSFSQVSRFAPLAGRWFTYIALAISGYQQVTEGLQDLAFKTPAERKENARLMANKWAGFDADELYAQTHPNQQKTVVLQPPEVRNDINIKINVEPGKPLMAATDSKNTRITLQRGRFFED